MKTKTISTVLAAAICFCLLISLSAAAENKQSPSKTSDTETKARLQHKIEQMIIWELSNTLKLSQDKEEKLFDALRAHFRDKKELAVKQFKAMKELRDEHSKSGANDATIKTKLDQLLAAQEAQMRLEIELQKKIKTFLTPREQAEFVLEWPKLIEKTRGMLKERRQGRGKRGEHRQEQ